VCASTPRATYRAEKRAGRYTFPAEAAFESTEHATKVYSQLVRRLLRNGTTTALYFGSNHLLASLVLADICGKYGQRALVGKTCSDQLVPEYYVETTAGSLKDTEEFIKAVRMKFGEGDAALVQPVITPRFVPTCSIELLKGLGELAHKYGCHVQTHAAESVDQVALGGLSSFPATSGSADKRPIQFAHNTPSFAGTSLSSP
jgi:guanine deaminase